MQKYLTNRLAALAFPVCALTMSPAQAANVDSNVADFTFITDTSEDTKLATGAHTINAPEILSIGPELERFNDYYGVLTGVTLRVESDQTLFLDVQASGVNSTPVYFAGRGNVGAGNAVFNPTGGSKWSWGGNVAIGDNAVIASSDINCTSDCALTHSKSTAGKENAISAIAGDAALNAYVGSDTVSQDVLGFQWTPASIRANVHSTDSGVTASAAATMIWAGSVTATYTYLSHAYASFNDGLNYNDELTLDFGSVQRGSAASPRGFSLYNLENESTGLDFTGISGSSGDTSVFSTDLAAFNDLLSGDFLDFLAFFDTSHVGSFAATYTLSFRDTTGVGASASRHSGQTLKLNLLGSVAPVPVPPAVWLFGSALAGVAVIGRRKETA